MYLPIPDADGKTYNRTLGKSLIKHQIKGDNSRILVPTRDNYITVLDVNGMPYAEQLVWHMIYENESEQERICKLLEANDRFTTDDGFTIAEKIFAHTNSILAMVNPKRYCGRVDSTYDRVWGTGDANNTAGLIFLKMPPFIRNLIDRAVAPEKLRIDTNTLIIHACPTCHIRENGLVADVALYNPVQPKFSYRKNLNRFTVERVDLKFRGNAKAMKLVLTRYEPYPLVVPLFLGDQIINTNTVASKRMQVEEVPDVPPPTTAATTTTTTTTTTSAPI
ncbi:VP39 [Trabala vishnou gigantina nucleopolyhedrovirus]|uniref:VP39 n=1 Tax=Trabala vishnou gigantina nucleopolyhedrovirus TaxID=2863583 RepID=UPI002481FB0D|nr:VP39 [Trabala vishnou gigantina nucleopolyhedrovirus]QYC92714.1 VP39 [Trabala vishnou gigantina nucleopolyhedrovirus]